MSAQANKPKKDQQPPQEPPKDQQDGQEPTVSNLETVGDDTGEQSGANPPGSIAAEYEVLQPIYGVDTPGVKRMPGYRFHGSPAELDPLVKLGYLKRA